MHQPQVEARFGRQLAALAEDTPAGRATATEVAGGLRFTVDASGMPPGTHGAHVHMVGRCDPPGFESADALARSKSSDAYWAKRDAEEKKNAA